MLILCTLLHLAVDGVCGAALAAYAVEEPDYASIVYYFHLYSLIAFGFQWIAGWALDRKMSRILPGLALVPILLGLGALPGFGILSQSVLLGAGNCLFHVAAGILVLRRYPGYREPGVFVSGGAIGLGLGLSRFCGTAVFLCICAAATAVLLFRGISSSLKIEAAEIHDHETETFRAAPWISAGAAVLLLLCVTLRGFSGGSGASCHVMFFPCVFAAGKALGGVCCDAIGWRRTTAFIFILSFAALEMMSLSLSAAWTWLPAALLAFASNMTMPLTLRLLHGCCLACPGLMFGLAAGCLLPGTFWRESFSILPQGMIVIQFLSLFLAGSAVRRTEA
ncbi:MAG: hypothetical protein K6E38_05805 [Fretibacterium sp.]|nr:hypothetical protein [Fretibacterium sp.]